MTLKPIELNWTSSIDCPANQLQEVSCNLKENKYNIIANKTTFIKQTGIGSPNEGNYTWEDVELKSILENELPNLFEFSSYPIFQNSDGIRLVYKYLIKFDLENKSTVLKSLNQHGYILFSEIEEGFLVSKEVSINKLRELEGVDEVKEVSIIQRKRYNTVFVPTGIYIQPNKLIYLNFLPSYTLNIYGIIHSSFIIGQDNELLVAIHSSKENTIIKREEVIGYLIPQHISKPIKLQLQSKYNSLKVA